MDPCDELKTLKNVTNHFPVVWSRDLWTKLVFQIAPVAGATWNTWNSYLKNDLKIYSCWQLKYLVLLINAWRNKPHICDVPF